MNTSDTKPPKPATLVDIGANLTNSRFARDTVEVLQRARDAGVEACLVTGTSLVGSIEAVALCHQLNEAFPGMLYATAGVHPHDASQCTAATIAGLASLIGDNRDVVVAVGETGLDFNRNFSTPQQQTSAFERQLELAMETGLPLFLHERDATSEQLRILSSAGSALPPGVAHCFTGERSAMEAYLELGLHIGITGWICDERRGQALQELVNEIPEHRLLVETDAPYLTPRTLRPRPKGGRNEPGFLPEVVATIAHCRSSDPGHIARVTTENARRLFKLRA